MNDKLRESISALADDEQLPDDSSDAMSRLLSEPELQQEWAQHHLIGEAMRNTLPDTPVTDLAERVRTMVDAEPVSISNAKRRKTEQAGSQRLLRPLTGLALAASVATVVILGVRSIEQPASPALERVVEVQQPTSELPPTVLTSGNRWNVSQRSLEDRLNAYLVNHSEYAGYGVQGMLPYARIVGYDAAER